MKLLKEKDTRPNILLIMTDQQRWDTIKAAGAEWMKTPNLDQLAAEGCLFENAYTNNPICMPARHTLLTGLPGREHGYPDNDWGKGMKKRLPTFPELLSDAGYETRTIGKNHFYPPRRHNGYLNMELMQEVPGYREQDEYLQYLNENGYGNVLNIHGVRNLLYMLPQRSLLPEEHHGTSWVAQRAVDFVQTNNGEHPWLLKLGFIAPHPPFNVPDEFADLYKGVEFPEPLETQTTISPLAEENKLLGDLPTVVYVRRMRELYYASITHIDHHLGCIVESLKETGQLDNTLIIFTSDHGEMLGDYGTYQKWLPYDACSRIPMIIRFPEKLRPGTRRNDFVDLADLFSTILDAAGVDYPADFDLLGESLFAENPLKDRSRQYVEYSVENRRWISLRDEHFKFNYYFGGGREELFDLEKDPGETLNLLESEPEEYEEVRSRLKAELTIYEQRFGLEDSLENGELVIREPYKPKPYRNRVFPVFQEKLTRESEKGKMNDFICEVADAAGKETVVKFEDLDLAAWQKNGDFSDDDIKRLFGLVEESRNK
ncbi:MAG: sulfatase-like hydrolase/transferase [Bacteroidetes bacterium]|nr:sulfatase-like hydrolase/transferase [Bacteroidota bacterium]